MMKPYYAAALLMACASLSACANGKAHVYAEEKITEPKVIAISTSARLPWTIEIEQRLKAKGFEITHNPIKGQRTVRDGDSTLTYQESSTRYILGIGGSAPIDWANRCLGGGYKFDYITAELLDTKTGEFLMYYNGSGYSEGCEPFSGSIFADIAGSVDSLWK